MRPKGSAEKLEARRRAAAEMLLRGMKLSEVARQLNASVSSVKRWKDVLRQQGLDGLKSKRHRGRAPRLDSTQKQTLLSLLERGARAEGFPTDHWTCPRVAELVKRRFGVSYHVGHVWQILRDLGYSSPRKTSPTNREPAMSGALVVGCFSTEA